MRYFKQRCVTCDGKGEVLCDPICDDDGGAIGSDYEECSPCRETGFVVVRGDDCEPFLFEVNDYDDDHTLISFNSEQLAVEAMLRYFHDDICTEDDFIMFCDKHISKE